jgi:hypothetical protein
MLCRPSPLHEDGTPSCDPNNGSRGLRASWLGSLAGACLFALLACAQRDAPLDRTGEPDHEAAEVPGAQAPSSPTAAEPPLAPVVAAPTTVPSRGMEVYAGARLEPIQPGARYRSIRLGASVASLTGPDGTTSWAVADLSATHPDCLDVPACLILLSPEGRAETLFFGVQDDLLFHVLCVSVASLRDTGGPAAVEAWRRVQGGWIVHDTAAAICHNTREAPYRVERGTPPSESEAPEAPFDLPTRDDEPHPAAVERD